MSTAIVQMIYDFTACPAFILLDHQPATYKNDLFEIIWTDACSRSRTPARRDRRCSRSRRHTGLRLGDLLRLSWSRVADDAIVLANDKSRGDHQITLVFGRRLHRDKRMRFQFHLAFLPLRHRWRTFTRTTH
ncbi:hypothetical protein GPL17_36715 [Bradyrhizobium yuanmingense]|uniref:hypothetical protein n=1 Tax=Bradyrhizobium yuanmingense TaxID=108015 RepID=UPI0012F8005B|nr:hypothetical protein [Bradyrhizobium yuanmingense]MVT55928.1 hypothetical protein [Bradyrhizobium yuanmingense]